VQILYLRPARRTKKRKLSEEDEKLGEELGEKLGEELDEELQARQLERLSGLFSRSAWRRNRALLGK
jgi:predicted house-cleaning noncanonical NTP pyrophosphatase (MazG superfamily)